MRRVVLLSGGLGGARLAPPLARALGPDRLTIVANVGDDLEWRGLRVSPDVDSILYALAGVWDAERGWGRRGETFAARDALAELGEEGWFGVGDRDLALHLFRTDRLRAGETPTAVIAAALARFGVSGVRLLPASDEPNRTAVVLADGRRLTFQEWYVREAATPSLAKVALAHGAASAAALGAISAADVVILGPSNPVTSLGAILALRGMRAAVAGAPRRIAVSPVVCGKPSDHPGIRRHFLARAQVLAAEGREDRPASIGAGFVDLAGELWLDVADGGEATAIRDLGIEPVIAPLLDAEALARALARAIDA